MVFNSISETSIIGDILNKWYVLIMRKIMFLTYYTRIKQGRKALENVNYT